MASVHPPDESPTPPPSGTGFRILGTLILAIVGVAIVAAAVLMPIGLRGIDRAVLSAAGKGTETLDRVEERWAHAGKPGVANLYKKAQERIDPDDLRLEIFLDEAPESDRFLELWGGGDPFLEQIFADLQVESDRSHPPVLPLFLPRESRRVLGEFLEGSRNRAVQEVLANREIELAQNLMPVRSSSGQPLEAVIYLQALLLQGNHLPHEFSDEIRRLAEESNRANDLGEIEPIYLDWLTLGSQLQWQPLAELASFFEDREVLRRTAHLLQVLEEDGPVFVAAALWVGDVDEISAYLVENGRRGLDDLKLAMEEGKGAVELLLDRGEPVATTSWREKYPGMPIVLADLNAKSPVFGAVLKIGSVVFGLSVLFFAFVLIFRVGGKKESGQPLVISFSQSFLVAVAVAFVFLFFAEPLLFESDGISEFRFRFPNSVVNADVDSTTDEGVSMKIDQVTALSVLAFFIIQATLYLISWVKIREIRHQEIASHLKLRLLENEDHLFDSGLYVGLAGTVGAFILLAFGVIDVGLMAAYTSTLFGIVFVAGLKIFHLRPYRRFLILESQRAG
ncbi:MAG TPA: hypothetical protein VK041_08845 [Opitutales bacterium]|nr:hypothetical protein [Opitutales bacterium]